MLIVFEGLDCSGKSTQAKMLFDYLTSIKTDVLLTKEPGGSAEGTMIRLLLTESYLDETEKLFLFLADRAIHVRKVIRPALDSGTVVISDRYHDSTEAYQIDNFSEYELSDQTIAQLKILATRELVPDVTFLIDVPEEVAFARMQNRKENNVLDVADLLHLKMIRSNFLEIWANQKDRKVIKINGNLPEDEVHDMIRYWYHIIKSTKE